MAAVPAFAGSRFASVDEIDADNTYMVFEAFARYLLDHLHNGRIEDAKAGFQFINELSKGNKGESFNLIQVSVLEPLAEDPEAWTTSKALLEGDARQAFVSLLVQSGRQ